jgi:hypothetical protein
MSGQMYSVGLYQVRFLVHELSLESTQEQSHPMVFPIIPSQAKIAGVCDGSRGLIYAGG